MLNGNEGGQPIEHHEEELKDSRALLLEMGFTEEQLNVSPENRSQEREGFHDELIIPQAEPTEIIQKVEEWLKTHGSEKIGNVTEEMLIELTHDWGYMQYIVERSQLVDSPEAAEKYAFVKNFLNEPILNKEKPVDWESISAEDMVKHDRNPKDGAYSIRLLDMDWYDPQRVNDYSDYKVKPLQYGFANAYWWQFHQNETAPDKPVNYLTLPEYLLSICRRIDNNEGLPHDNAMISASKPDKMMSNNGGFYVYIGQPNLKELEPTEKITPAQINIVPERSAGRMTRWGDNGYFIPMGVVPESLKRK